MSKHAQTSDTIYAGNSDAYTISAPHGITFTGTSGLGRSDMIYLPSASTSNITLDNMISTTIINNGNGKINLTTEGFTGDVKIFDFSGGHITIDNSLYGNQATLERHVIPFLNPNAGFSIGNAITGGWMAEIYGAKYTPGMVTWHAG